MKIHVDTQLTWNGTDVIARANRVVEKSPYESGLIIEAQAASFCPIDIATLRNSISVRDNKKTHSIGTVVLGDLIGSPTENNVALVGTNVKYSRDVEYGTRPHAINSPVKIKGNWVYIGMHPGTRAQPFMRPALDLSTGKVLTVFETNSKQEFKEYFKEKA